jgi:hypothetical protein
VDPRSVGPRNAVQKTLDSRLYGAVG